MAKAPKVPQSAPATANGEQAESIKAMPLNFKVSAPFRREFKTYAAQHNKKLNQLLL